MKTVITTKVKRLVPTFVRRWLYQAGITETFRPRVGKIRRGDLDYIHPFSENFGFDRGGAIDRYYIEKFLQANAEVVKGRVLEVGDNAYTMQYGGSRVTKSDVLHIAEGNSKATIIGDLSNAPHIPDNSFDCIILTQTLHLIYDMKAALQTCNRILKPGGTLLLTVPGISHIDYVDWQDYWLWSLTSAALRRLLSETFPDDHVAVQSHGNVFVATAFLYGMGLREVKKEKLDFHDPHYQVIVTGRATKPLVN